MSVLSLPVAMAAAVTAYVGLYHLWLHTRRPNSSDRYFALTCFCMLGYDTAAALHYSATTPSQAALWQRVEIASALLMGVPFLLLVNEQMQIRLPRVAKVALGLFPALGVITLVERKNWVVTDTPLPKHIVTPWGDWTLLEVALGPLFLVAAATVPLMTLPLGSAGSASTRARNMAPKSATFFASCRRRGRSPCRDHARSARHSRYSGSPVPL